jgi:2-polyprenyl-3-methyl-5-hydroxy-6-metoxy-1,4-benzoquinol methylase
MSTREFLEEITAGISSEYPMLARGLLANQLAPDDPLWEWAEVATEHVLRITGRDHERVEQCVEAFVVTSLDFLRLQARFLKTGRYAHGAASDSIELYSDAERMTEYLDGLALTYAMWPNHTRMLRFFATEFGPRVPAEGRILEVGPGHGLLAAVLLTAQPDARYTGVDISPHSISYAAEAFAATGIAPDRYELLVSDACNPDVALAAAGPFDAAVCCEVLEHVDDPAALLRGLHDRIAPSAPTFVSTVANMEAEDHVFLFDDEQHIHRVLQAGGFAVYAEQPLELAGFENATPRPLNYSAIVAPRLTA